MTSVVADDAGLRQDLRIARSLGVSLRRFHGWEPPSHTHHHPNGGTTTTTTEPEFDEWERALWRAFDEWEADRCPDCGQPLTDSLWNPETPEEERAKWRASYQQCRACLELENAQIRVADDDRKYQQQHQLDHPPPHRHRKWRVERDDKRGR